MMFTVVNKKAFQSDSNCPLADSLHFVVNKFEHVQGMGWPGLCTMRSKLNKFEYDLGDWGPVERGRDWALYRNTLPVSRQT